MSDGIGNEAGMSVSPSGNDGHLPALRRRIGALRYRRPPYRYAVPLAFITVVLSISYVLFLQDQFGLVGRIIDSSGYILGRDFMNYWTASVLVDHGRTADIFDLRLFHEMQEHLLARSYPPHLWSYPPTALFLILPLGQLPYLWAFAAWVAVGLAVYLATLAFGHVKGLDRMFLALAPASLINVYAGQNGFFTAALLLGGLALLDRRPWLAGVLIGLLSFKPQLGVLIPIALVAGGYWRPLIGATLTTVALFLASVLVFGGEVWRAYIDVGAATQTEMLNQAAGAFVRWMPTVFMSARLLGLGVVSSYLVQAAFAAAAVIGVVWIFRVCQDRELQIAALIAGTVLAVPYLHVYDLPMFAAAVFWSCRRGFREGFFRGELALHAAAWLLPFLTFPANAIALPIGPVCALGIFLSVLLRASRTAGVEKRAYVPVPAPAE